MEKLTIYYFGCIGDVGHYLHNQYGSKLYRKENISPWQDWELDSKLCPGYIGPYQSGPQIQGQANLTHKDGWTALSFWDRSVDGSGGSNSSFLVSKTLDFQEAIKLFKEVYPQIWSRFGFEVTEVA
jgi:hypothetical protein